jgi:hypothetical protein
MRQAWKNFRINLMYWRFRNITRNRLRLQAWYRRRQPMTGYRPRGTAAFVRRRSSRQTWIALLVMVILLTAIRVHVNNQGLSQTLVYLLTVVVIVGAIYWALRGVS